MGKNDVRKALEAMDDDDVRARLADGDFADVGELELSDDERRMVQDAAADYPDVAGFAMMAYIKFDAKFDIKLDGKFNAFQSAFEYTQG